MEEGALIAIAAGALGEEPAGARLEALELDPRGDLPPEIMQVVHLQAGELSEDAAQSSDHRRGRSFYF